MKFSKLVSILLVFAFLVSNPLFAHGDACIPVSEKRRFIRVIRDDKNAAQSLDTAIITYSNAAGITVDLIAALHIGEDTYYEGLNKKFEGYDSLLYELIAPKGVNSSAKEESGGNVLSFLQRGIKDFLKLDFQLDKIDYSRPNFVHADMSPDEFAQSMKKRGESPLSMILKIMLKSSEIQKTNPGLSAEIGLMQILMDPNQKAVMRTLLAEQFQDLETLTQVLDGDEGSTILSGRNEVALKVLKDEIAKGKKSFGIFYGAGHMPDMEKRLIKEFAMSCRAHTWVPAWKLQ